MADDLLFNMCDTAAVRSLEDNGWKEIHAHLLRLCQARENNGFKKRNGMTQNQKLITHFKKAGSITVREAMVDYSIASLTKRIQELRDSGFNIESRVKHHPVTKQKYVRYHWHG